MTEKAKKQQVILKRNIITKAVITPKFNIFKHRITRKY